LRASAASAKLGNGDAVVRYDQLARRRLVVMPIFRRTVFDQDRGPGHPQSQAAARPVQRRNP
jgi:hypothetical protein